MFKYLIYIFFAVFLLAGAQAVEPPPGGFAGGSLVIATAGGERKFSIELATTPQQQEYGLMNRDRLAKDHGMLFLMGKERDIMMWMQDTRIALDMLFIDAHGHIVSIAANATPYSTAIIHSGKPASAVLEINGGEAVANGINVGDRVIYKAFTP